MVNFKLGDCERSCYSVISYFLAIYWSSFRTVQSVIQFSSCLYVFVVMVGFYLYMESSRTRPGQRADLVSPWTPARRGGQCLKFYYTMYGGTMGSLAIKLELSNGKNWFIFYKNGNQGKGWKKGMGNIDVSMGLSYKVRMFVARFPFPPPFNSFTISSSSVLQQAPIIVQGGKGLNLRMK